MRCVKRGREFIAGWAHAVSRAEAKGPNLATADLGCLARALAERCSQGATPTSLSNCRVARVVSGSPNAFRGRSLR